VIGRVALATCAAYPGGDEDAALLQRSLAAHGVSSSWQVWSDPRVDWDEFAAVIIRSTWDYTRNRDAFLNWASGLTTILNPAPVLAWNSDKVYASELNAAGIPVVPATISRPGQPVTFPDGEFVVKPSVGAGSRGAGRFVPSTRTAAAEHAQTLQAEGFTVIVQPYLAEVDTVGETALIYFDGAFSHAIGKGAMLAPDAVFGLSSGDDDVFVAETITARRPSEAELDVGAQVMRFVRERFGCELLYARVDLLPSADGPVVIELELTEPSLFLQYDEPARHEPNRHHHDHHDQHDQHNEHVEHQGASDRLAAAIVGRIKQ
jgi:hypothetical protein